MLSATPTTSWPRPWMVRPVGNASSVSRASTCVCTVVCTSTTGEAPETVIDSSREPTFRSALMVAVKLVGSSTPSRLNVENPLRVNVTTYVPGLRSTILYCPEPSVSTARVFSISTSLDASTVTPGSTAPDASFTTPAIALWADAMAGSSTTNAAASATAMTLRNIQASFGVSPTTGRRLSHNGQKESDYLQPN